MSKIHPDSGVNDGIFDTAYALRDAEDVIDEDRKVLAELLAWFAEHLPTPGRLNRSSSKGYYRRSAKGISWFKDTAEQHLSRMYELKRIAEAYEHFVVVIRDNRIGYVVYEDEFQVVAEPFADTQTRA